jgi:hypothetical protein
MMPERNFSASYDAMAKTVSVVVCAIHRGAGPRPAAASQAASPTCFLAPERFPKGPPMLVSLSFAVLPDGSAMVSQ